ncbi:MAG: hypothetical protein MUC87_20895 [Bacteroidia bacterium]|jgi:hypothetical protein|nr:hypothetical protein [Bacteroidia bacterium]
MFIELAIGAGAIWLASKAVGWAKNASRLMSDVKVRIHKLTLTRITLGVSVVAKNPTKNTYRFKHPVVVLEYKKQVIGTSVIQNINYEIVPFSELGLNDTLIEINVMALPALAVDIFRILQTATGNAPILIRTTIPTYVGNELVSFTDEQTITL